MSRSKKKLVQYLKEARASELALTRVLQSQIAMTPQGSFRTVLERHLFETREHARLLQTRVREVEGGFHPVQAVVGVAEGVVGQALALSKTPLDLVRGTGGEEKVLKNAKDAAATESLEIATYVALERLARRADDRTTAELAARIRTDEERTLDAILAELPALTDAVWDAEVGGDRSYDPSTTGAADAARAAVGGVRDAADRVADRARDAADDVRDAAANAKERASETADRATSKASDLADDARETASEVADAARDTATDGADRAAGATGSDDGAAGDTAGSPEKPWPAYDELTGEEVLAVLLTADAGTAQAVLAYEQANDARADVLSAAERKAPTT